MKNRVVCSKHKELKHEQTLRGCGKTTSFLSVWLHRQPLHQCLARILSSAQTSQNLVAFSYICLGREPKPSNNTFLGLHCRPDSACILSSVTREPCSPYCQCLPTSSPASNRRPFRASPDGTVPRDTVTQRDPMVTDHTIVHIAPLGHLITGINHPSHTHWKIWEVVWQHNT